MSASTPGKRRPGRPRKNPEATQRELNKQTRQQRALLENGERARRELARREVRKIVREVFNDSPYFGKLVAALFMDSAQRVAGSTLDVERSELGGMISSEFIKILSEYASFDGLTRTATQSGPVAVPTVVAAAATPDLSSFADSTLGDFDDGEVDLEPLSDADAAVMGFLPEA